MSSALNADKSFPNKVVLHEHNKPTMGTSYVGPKTRIIVKRNMILKEKSKETESTLLDKKIRKYDMAPVRSKTQQISRENSNISKSSKSEKGLLKKSNLSKTSGLNDRNLSNSNDVNGIVSERTTNESDIITTENMSNDCDSGLMNLLSDAETHINGPQNSDETCKQNDIDKSVSKQGLELSHTSVSSIQKDVGTTLQHVLENSSSNMLHIENSENENKEYTFMNVTPATSGIRRQTSLKKSIPKPQSVILDSCDDSQHKNFEVSDANKDIFHITNSPNLMHHNCNMESDLDQIEGVTAGTCKQTENVLSLNKEYIEQTVSLSKNTKLSARNAKPGEKSQKSYLQGNIPSYLRMTSSAANKEIKKKSEIKQRSVTRENNSKSFVKQSDKYSNKTDLKRSTTKDLQSMHINGIQSSVTKTTSRDTTFVDDASSPEDLTLTLGYDKDSKDETTSNDPDITQVNKFSSQSQNHIKKEINQKCTKSSSKQTAKLPVKSKTIIPRVSVVKSKQATVNIRPRSLTPNDSKPKSIALKQRSQQGIHIGQRSRSTTPGVSDGSCSINDIISKKSLNTEDNQTNGKTTLNAQQTTREDVNVQKQKSTGKGSGVQPRSVIRTDLESKSISLKNQCSQDRSSRSRSTTPSASSVSSDSSCSKTTKLPSKTFDIIPKNVKRIKSDKSSQYKGFKSNQDSKLNKPPERKLQTSKKTIEKEKSINRDFGTYVTSTQLKSNDQANETGQVLKRVSKSKSRSTTPEISSMCSSHSKSSSPNIPQSVKEVPKVKSPTGTHKSNIQSALISSPSGSLSGKGDTLTTNKIKMNKPMKKKEKSPEIISVDSTKNNLKLTTLHSNRNSSRKDGTVSRDLNSRSQSNTPRMSPSSPICNAISNLDQVDSETSRIKTGKNNKTGIDTRVKSNVTTTVSSEQHDAKQESPSKDTSAKVKPRVDTRPLASKYSSIKSNVTSKPTSNTSVLRHQNSKTTSEIDRKSRSRSSTPGASSCNIRTMTTSELQYEQEKKPISSHTRSEAKYGRISKIPREISAKSKICKSNNRTSQKQDKITPVAADNSNVNNKQPELRICQSTECHKHEQGNDQSDQLDKTCTASSINSISRPVTRLDSTHHIRESCNSFTTISENSKRPCSESKVASRVLSSENNGGNKIKTLSTQETVKPIMELSELSVKSDLRIKTGKIRNSVKNKNTPQEQTSSENRIRLEIGSKNTRNKTIKTVTSDNKLRQTQRMSAIKRDFSSTKPSFKSGERVTSKQSSQLSGKLTVCNVNSKIQNEDVCNAGGLIGEESLQIMEVKEVSLCFSDKQNCEIKEITKLDLTENIENETTNKQSAYLQELKSGTIDNHENSEGLLVQSLNPLHVNKSNCFSENKTGIKPENVNCTFFSVEKYQYSACDKCRDIHSSDREANARDPIPKVISNCLSDVRENEIQRVNCEIYTGMNTGRNKITNCECEKVSFSNRKPSLNQINETDQKTHETAQDMESKNMKHCSNCTVQINNTMPYVSENGDYFFCESCKGVTENDSDTILFNKKDMTVKNNTTCKCDGNCNNYEHIVKKSRQQSFHDSICHPDQKNQNSTSKIDTYDVNSSNEMPITEGCAFKLTDLSDPQEDKAKCTHAMPVTGAVSFQSTHKRQDKKIASLSNCGKRNIALCSNKNCLLRDSDKDIVPHFDKNCESAITVQAVTSMESGNDKDVVISSSMTPLFSDFETNKNANEVMSPQSCESSVDSEQNISDWHNAEILDIISVENESKLQVMNKCEINKEISEPKNLCENLDSRDNLSGDDMKNVLKLENVEPYTDGINSHDFDCGIIKDLKIDIDIGNTAYLQLDTLKQESPKTTINDADQIQHCCDIEICDLCDGNDKENDKDISCKLFQHVPLEESDVLAGSRQENTLTCSSKNVPGISFTDNENCLPERNSRTTDVKLISSDDDLSLHTKFIGTDEFTKPTELCHNGLLQSSEQITTKSDKSLEIDSKTSEDAIYGILPDKQFLQSQLQRFKPGGVLSEVELRKDMTCKPYVLEAQEKQTNCFHYGNDSECLFVQESTTEDELIMLHCENDDEFQQKENDILIGGQKKYFQDNGYLVTDSGNYEKNIFSIDTMNEKQSKTVPDLNSSSFCNIPKLSVMLCEMYPNLREKNEMCIGSSNKNEINYKDSRCSNMTQNASLDTCSLNMKLNDSACLFQSYTQLDRDDIKLSPECLHCADLSQAPENISNSYSKKLHSQDDLTEANSTEHGSLKITGNKLCTGSLPCDGNNEKISTHINLSKSTEYPDLNELSLSFDVHENINSGWTMSRDSTHVAAAGTDLRSELSANLTDSETLKNHNPGLNQDCYEDKKYGELSAVKITTQKSSCNLKFSEKSNEPKDLLLRYEHHKKSAGHKKIYSCKDELDISIASTQEEYNFRNLAAIRDEDINCEIKLNNINLETPKHCVSSSLESAHSAGKVISTGIQGQCSEIEANICSVGNEKYFETPDKPLIGQFNSDQESSFVFASKGDLFIKETKLSCDNDALSEDIRLSCAYPKHRSDTDNLQNQNVKNGLLQEISIKTDICQTERDVNALLTVHKEESISKLNLPGKFINTVSGFKCAENELENQTEINVLKSPEPCCTLKGQKTLQCGCVTHTDSILKNDNINTSTEDLCISNENCANEIKFSQFQSKIQGKNIHDCMQSNNNSNDNASNTQENSSPSDETSSDASEAFTDAEDRLSSPNTDNTCTLYHKHSVAGSKELNISCGASTSTESFVDAVESLDDDYLTSTNFRNSREFKNEETVSQTSSSANDSSTGIAGSMDDLSGWEEFTENIEDINDYNGDMEANSVAMTNVEGNNSRFCLTEGQAHAPVCITKHVSHDKNYQSPSPPSKTAEIYLSKIKRNTLRYKDTGNGAEQKIIGSSIFETGNGGTVKDIDVPGVRLEAKNVGKATRKDVCHSRDSQDSKTVLSNENDISLKNSNTSKITTKIETTGHRPENTIPQTASAVGSKIETAVIKRTERRRRRQIEQQKCIACYDSKGEDTMETNALEIRHGEQARDNDSIEKNSCPHSEHSQYSCTVSDNTTFSKVPASGTGELSQQVNTSLTLNELNLEHSLNSGTPLNYDLGNNVTNEVSYDEKTDKTTHILIEKKNDLSFATIETQCDRNFAENNVSSGNGGYYDIKNNDKAELNSNNEIQLTIDLQENVRNDVNLDDFEFIDADESNQDCQVSPNVSFTFSFDENRKEIDHDNCEETNNVVTTTPAVEDHMSCDHTLNKTKSKPKTCILDKTDEKGTHTKDDVENEMTVLKELHVTSKENTSKNSANTEDKQNDMKCVNTDKMASSDSAADIVLDSQQNNASVDVQADVCEESNISVRLALEMEKQKLADDDENRSRKSLFMSSRAGRRATIETCSFENTEDTEKIHELCNDKERNGKPEIKKSKSFRMDRKQISPMASFMNPPQIPDSNDKDGNESVDLINKKVSDICKSFMTKTRSSAQRTRAKTLSKSPAPQRKLMKWVNNNGKWMRMPVDDSHENRDGTSACSTPSDISTTSDSYSPETPEIIIDMVTAKSFKDNEKIKESEECTLTYETNHTYGTSDKHGDQETVNVSETRNQSSELINGDTKHAVDENTTPEAQKDDVTRSTDFAEKIYTDIEKGHDNNILTSSSDKKHTISEETDSKHMSDVLTNTKDHLPSRKESTQHNLITVEYAQLNDQFDSKHTTLHSESGTIEADIEPEMKVIGTTFDDAQSDQEKHRQRQELLFGLLDSFNRRKPRRLTPREPDRNIQISQKSDLSNAAANKIERQCSDNSSVQTQETISDDNLKSIPKIKAVKIQEEVFECKTEYLKDTNIRQSPECNKNSSQKNLSEQSMTEEITSGNAIDFKSRKLLIKKSKTFAGLGDIERQRYISRRLTDNTKNSSDDKKHRTVDEETENYSINNGKTENELHTKNSITTMTEKRIRAGLKLNLDTASASCKNAIESDRSPIRLGPEQSRGRPSGDRSPNRLCVDQSKVRLRSPDKGPRQLQRNKLLSEIVEVEENKDDVSLTCDQRRQQQQQYYSDRQSQRQESTKPVRRSNKRRSLSLPTGTLAFGDARIVYKNGHFTIETMDNSEYDCNESADYHSSSRHLDSNVDDMWEMPDTSGDSRETTDIHNKPHMRRQNAKTVLQSSDSTEDVFYNETELNINGDAKVLNMGRTNDEVFNESCSSRTSDMSVDSYYSEGMDLSTDESVTDSQKLSSSSLPETKDVEVKHVMQRAKRTSSFRAAQERGALRLSGIDEDKVHNSTRARSVSLDSQKSDLNKSPKVQSVQNQNPTFLKKVMAKRKTLNENLNISGFSKQSESAKEFFTKKMTLKGLFRKNKSDSSVNSPIKTEHPVSPPIATFQDDDIGSVDTPPGSPYRNRNIRRRHTSADILKTYPDSSETDSNCPTPTQERSNKSRHSISSPSTPSHEANSFLNLSSHASSPQFRDDDEMSITSASSFASSIHSPPLEQPHKPKTPKPVGASPRRNQSFSYQLSRSGSQSSQRNVMNSVTSLESDQYEPVQDDVIRDPRCECVFRSEERKRRMSNRNVRGSTDSITMCQFCKQMEFYKSDSAFSNSSFYKQQLTGKEKQGDDGARIRKDSSGRNNYDRLGIISQADVASSNSNDSGIQRDASVHSSNESIKGTADTRIRLRRNKSLSPHPDRPKSEIGVRWADGDSGDYDITETTVKLRNKSARDRPRPKSDLDGSSFLSERMKAFGSEINLQPYCSLRSLYEMKRNDLDRQKNRRMSTPHPIKSRLQRAPQKLHKQQPLVRSSSMPESLEKIHKRRKMHHLLDYHLDTLSRHIDIDTLSDESDLSFDQASLQERSISVQSSSSQLTAMDEDEDNLTYAEALWDHITMDPEELGFRAQDVIEVLDMADKDWWFGVIDDREGWFPATFVRIRVNQDELEDDLDLDTTIQDNLTTSPKLRRISMFNKNQARSNVVNEIINAEKEYVKHLKDVVEGYIQHARKRTEMFPEERIALIFGNLEKIYSFAQKFVSQLEMCIDVCPHLSEIGQCFLDNERGFEIYSDYCNNHPSACEELDELCKDSKYKHFFEACRLLQELVEIPLEGFLLTPVQKICKYPLQLAELLKYTPPDHADYQMVKDALAAMRKIATLINERKRKMESIEKIAVWQHSVVDWEGPDLLEGSSELIFSGELNKINTAGWSQERFFFLFDHQVVYCKKELLKRHVFSYKGRIDLDHCDIIDIPDGKDSQYNVTVKHAWKFHETLKDKWYLIYAKSEAVKQSWLKAIRDERQRVLQDQENDFCVPDHWKQTVLNKVRCQSHLKDKQSGGRMSHGQLLMQKDLKDFTYATLPRHRTSQKHDKKKGWFKFGGGKKSKR